MRGDYRSLTTSSAIWTALVAAPLRIWSPQHQRFSPSSLTRSSRMRPTNTRSWSLVSSGVGYSMVLALCACGGTPASTAASAAPSAAATKGADTNTVAVGAVIIARDDVPTDEIYTFVKTIFDNKDTIAQQHGKGAELNLDFASSITSVPYHPGAAKYFEEQGKKVASVKEGAGTGAASALMFGTGGESGTYYAFGGVLASYVTGNSDVSVTAVTSDGSKANIEDLAAGDVQIAFAQSDVLSYAYNGERLFTSPVKGFSVVAALYMTALGLFTLCVGGMGVLGGKNVLVLLVSIVFGTLAGTVINIDGRIDKLGKKVEARFSGNGTSGGLAQSFVTATLMMCVGAMLCGLALFAAVNLQQFGIGTYPAEAAASGRSGFLTATYVVMEIPACATHPQIAP